MLWVLIRSASMTYVVDYSLEMPHHAASNEYLQHVFMEKNVDAFGLKKASLSSATTQHFV